MPVLQVFQYQLFVGVGGFDNSELWKFDGSNWTLINDNGFNRSTNEEICGAAVFDKSLFVAFSNESSEANLDILKSTDGANFTRTNVNPFPDYVN